MPKKRKIETKTTPAKQARKRPRKRVARLDFDDVVISFQGIDLQLESGDLSDRETDVAESVASSIFAGFSIDKSYVAFDGNLHGDAYVELADWQWTCAAAQIPRDMRTDFQQECLHRAYEMLVLGYAYQMLANAGIALGRVELSIAPSPFIVELRYDVAREWKSYADAMAAIVELDKKPKPEKAPEKKPRKKRSGGEEEKPVGA